MIYENIELFNVSELTPDGRDGMLMHRFPLSVEQALTDQGKRMNVSATGIEFRFRMLGDRVTLKLRMENEDNIGIAYVYQGSVIRGSMDCTHYIRGDKITEIVIERIADMTNYNAITESGRFPFDPELVRVVLNAGRVRFCGVEGECEPPREADLPARTYLAYGSSITHGSVSLNMPSSFVSLTAQHFRADARNLGMAGSCRLEPEVAHHIAEMGRRGEWDLATLCMGINVLSWEPSKIEERVDYMIRTVADANPEKPVFCISPLYCGSDRKENGLAENWRTIIKRLVKQYNAPNVHYISGLQLLDGSYGLSGDHVHPSPLGVRTIAANLIRAMEPWLIG